MSQPVLPPEGPSGDHAAQVSSLVARTMATFSGRGPVKVRTVIGAHDVHVVLENVLTKVESNLVTAGYSDQVLGSRAAVQDALEPGLVAGVQAIVGREVIAFLSSNHLSPDISIESFVLGQPVDGAINPAS
ncbi:MAG: Na-translocating system protein MpsC family protein [Solirubrobacteraceae bacterium]|nr:Na-translocating system protein MpsC family protein [Solirubrobacteraceae bacterium]